MLNRAEIKAKLKAWRDQARTAYINRFHAFTPADLVAALQSLGVQPGDALIAHTSFAEFAGFQGGIGEAIRALQAAVTEQGTLLIPTLPFSGSALEYAKSGAITDVKRTPSRMGFITEIFRRGPGVIRSIHPTHPIAAWGAQAAELTADHHTAETPCGRNSPFHRLLEMNGKILLAGVDVRAMTFFHYLEEHLEPQMPFSPFTKEWFELQTRGVDGQLYSTRTRLYAPEFSAKRDVRLMIPVLRAANAWHEAKAGRLNLIVLSARDVVSTGELMARQGSYCYLS
ncbi:MAG: AAC(3) family N-acetyltransferase [Bryobacterales bacterium]|nr:AAC(3) family N-acetyltransferase [Bryobacterales bacterium]